MNKTQFLPWALQSILVLFWFIDRIEYRGGLRLRISEAVEKGEKVVWNTSLNFIKVWNQK